MMVHRLTFQKESSGRWYIVLPDWIGAHADLEMVEGADTFLDQLSQDDNYVTIEVSELPFEGCSELELVNNDLSDGADYLLKNYEGVSINHKMWLCDVTQFVLGHFPSKIYFSKIG